MEESAPEIPAAIYLDFLRCPRRAWFALRKAPDGVPAGEFSPGGVRRSAWKAVLEKAAADLLPPMAGDFRGLPAAEREARTLLAAGNPAQTAAGAYLGTRFSWDALVAEPDVLVLKEDGAREFMEIKTALGPKSTHFQELAWNVEILSRLGIRPEKVLLVHLNGSAEADETRHAAGLFITLDVTKRVRAGAVKIAEMRAVLSGETPPPPDCPPCFADCPYAADCGKPAPKHSVFTLHQGRLPAAELYRRGIADIRDIPPETRLSRKQRIQVEAAVSGVPFADTGALSVFLASLSFPLSFLDFETFSSPLPLFPGTTPWRHLPFQFSLHILRDWDGEPEHRWFIASEGEDPRPAFIAALREDLPAEGSIVVYNRRFESGILVSLGRRFPEFASWTEETSARMADLLAPFAEFRFYHPDQAGRVSMKKVLPALTDLDYDGFAVGNGEAANAAFAGMVYRSQRGDPPGGERETLRAALEEYCRRDTEGMIHILKKLRETVRGTGEVT